MIDIGSNNGNLSGVFAENWEDCPECGEKIKIFTYYDKRILLIKESELLELECFSCGAEIHHVYEGGECEKCEKAYCIHPDFGYDRETKKCKICRYIEEVEKEGYELVSNQSFNQIRSLMEKIIENNKNYYLIAEKAVIELIKLIEDIL
ncbi:MAG: hypothetical protein GF311_03645, partial [Candidatus Lokiarchaeota archaeon]|nr:hypothetical protein [Candidatus Lokiarchaeota archaeon]